MYGFQDTNDNSFNLSRSGVGFLSATPHWERRGKCIEYEFREVCWTCVTGCSRGFSI